MGKTKLIIAQFVREREDPGKTGMKVGLLRPLSQRTSLVSDPAPSGSRPRD